ncbi:hypothetical protein GII36_00650 [Candidatus Mycosynbacter amalyticus]|uniref:Uncharacterized protein n=1 Tax=Candidatus Mycosynbacter amalyticus TaxID=2665156 RepID=A0A857MJQ0_9BACT|nr:hypothetical protein [Candidatus Mycosynbacter amalyticus]QHN42368.1 hypothetical protein GII36_00650 [Candidatus Mycosynbacter amalyticus]
MHSRTHHRLHRPPWHATSLYARAWREFDEALYETHGRGWELVRVEWLSRAIDDMKQRVERSSEAERVPRLIALLLLQAPRAARAQHIMDSRHGHGYHNRSKRLYELIDFNDTLVDIVLALSHEQRQVFAQEIYTHMSTVCRRSRTHMFTREQFDAITHGLSRETAVYLAARETGLDVHMTSRVADGLGVDMQVRDGASDRYINIDCKTTGAYLRRVEELRREGRLREDEVAQALTRGYIEVLNGHRKDQVRVVLFAVVTEAMGEIRGFEFTRTDLVAGKLHEAIRAYGRHDGQFYRYEA